MGATPLVDEAAALGAARLALPGGVCDRDRVARLRREVHEDLPAVDAAARGWSRLGRDLPATEVAVVGRLGWIRANLAAMRGAFDTLAARLEKRSRLASQALGLQIGAFFGLLSRRVLGQYVLPLGGPGGGQLLVVGPNLLALEDREPGVAGDIRRAVLLHETVHRLQFDSVPWLGDHLRDLLERYLQAARVDVSAAAQLAERLPEAINRALEAGTVTPVIETVLTPEQSEIIGEAQGLMSLLEGHGNAAMYAGADGVVGDADAVREAMARRRSDPMNRLLTSLAGLDLKRQQYDRGEAFVQAVVATAGIDRLNQAFERPEHLPDREEIDAPERWLERLGADTHESAGDDGDD